MNNTITPTQDVTKAPPLPAIGSEAVLKFTSSAIAAISEEVSLTQLLPATGVAFNTLTRNFKKQIGLTPMHWLWTLRTFVAGAMLAEIPGSNITSVAFHCGFSSSSHFSRKFSEVFEQTPSQLRKTFRGKILCQEAKQELLVSLVKEKYHPCLPLMIESISEKIPIISIFNPKH